MDTMYMTCGCRVVDAWPPYSDPLSFSSIHLKWYHQQIVNAHSNDVTAPNTLVAIIMARCILLNPPYLDPKSCSQSPLFLAKSAE